MPTFREKGRRPNLPFGKIEFCDQPIAQVPLKFEVFTMDRSTSLSPGSDQQGSMMLRNRETAAQQGKILEEELATG